LLLRIRRAAFLCRTVAIPLRSASSRLLTPKVSIVYNDTQVVA
jgi:hypothetical protein